MIIGITGPNEVEAIRAVGGIIWKTTHGTGLAGGGAAHESESHIDSLMIHASFGEHALERMPIEVARFLEIWRGELAKRKGAL